MLTTILELVRLRSGTHMLAPAPGTWLVRGGTGNLFALAIQTYYGNPDGSVGTGDGATYVLEVKALQ